MPLFIFQDDETLDAADMNEYLSLQAVMTFANAAARNSALSAYLRPGLFVYLEDVDRYEHYTGSAWVPLDVWSDDLAMRGSTYTPTTSYAALLSLPMEPNAAYAIEGLIYVTGMTNGAAATYGMSFTWDGGLANTCTMVMENDGGGSGYTLRSTTNGDLSGDTTHSGTVDNAGTTYAFRGLIQTDATVGSRSLRIRKVNSAGTGTVQVGSHIALRRVL